MKYFFVAALNLATLFAAPLCVVAKDAPASVKPAAAQSPIAAALQPFVDSHSLAGAVTLVADKDKVLAVDAIGFADIAGERPMKPDTMFWIASQTKSITGAALMILVDDGKVSLDDPIEKYLPEMKALRVALPKGETGEPQPPKHLVTVREVLSHTSGMPFRSAKETPTLDALTLEAAVKTYAATPLTHEPGSKYQYSNAGINTAGRIIEVVSGKKYEDFLDERLLKPLGMTDTTYWPSEEQVSRLATSYSPNKEKTNLQSMTIGQLQYPLYDKTKRYPMPAGGLFSTAGDVARFCQMLLNKGKFDGKQILSENAVKALTSKQTGDAVKDGYGLGFSVGGGSFGHGGAMSTNMNVDTTTGLITVFLVQHAGYANDGGKCSGVFRDQAKALYGKK
ncbi:MAG: beta-lactamase family protein [Planctomycetia bacterium]|nr:beta-lactamase family protein [Planctomycetia bacterium]